MLTNRTDSGKFITVDVSTPNKRVLTKQKATYSYRTGAIINGKK